MSNIVPTGVEERGGRKCFLFKDAKTGNEDSLCVLMSREGEDPNVNCGSVLGEPTCLNDHGMEIHCAVPEGSRDECYDRYDVPDHYRR